MKSESDSSLAMADQPFQLQSLDQTRLKNLDLNSATKFEEKNFSFKFLTKIQLQGLQNLGKTPASVY